MPFATLQQHILPFMAAPLAVACSGGLDSISLLHAVCALSKAHASPFKPLALHIDHGINPDSVVWGQQVQRLAECYGANFASVRVTGLSSTMPSLENAARIARHAALDQLCQAHQVATLLLAHHANDQAETILLNLLRGSGLAGMGMPKARTVGATQWLRPCLGITRLQIEQYAQQHSLTWIDDPSNTDETLRRNAMRHTLWPVVQAVEPRALPSLLRFAELAQAAAHTELALAQACLKPYLINQESNHALTLTSNYLNYLSGLNWLAISREHNQAVQAVLLRTWLASLGCKAPTQAKLYAMLGQLNAKTGDGLRCRHQAFDLVYRDRFLWAIPSR